MLIPVFIFWLLSKKMELQKYTFQNCLAFYNDPGVQKQCYAYPRSLLQINKVLCSIFPPLVKIWIPEYFLKLEFLRMFAGPLCVVVSEHNSGNTYSPDRLLLELYYVAGGWQQSIDYIHIYNIYIYIHMYTIMKAMCHPGYYLHAFVATHALGHMIDAFIMLILLL